MSSRGLLSFALVALAALSSGCAREKAPTPPDVEARFRALLDTLDTDSPGVSAQRLGAFLEEAGRYQIADSVQMEMDSFRAATEGRYHEARALAREGEFDRAEHILEDLARLPDTPDGESAANHLKFDFYLEKARWLLVRQRFQESEAVARELLTRDLNRFQVDEVEKILDYGGHVDAALEMSSRQKARNACQQLVVLLANVYVNDGQYPSTLSVADLERLDAYGAPTISSSLASIEDYRATTDHYTLVAVSKGGHRFRIADGLIED
jgi:hypothetical protein